MRKLDLRGIPGAIPRPDTPEEPLARVREIIERVREERDRALFELTAELDGVRLDKLEVGPDEVADATAGISGDLKDAIDEASSRIRLFASQQKLEPWRAEIGGGVIGELVSPVARAGLYVPGGHAIYPSSVLMSAIPAKVAGVDEIALCVPPDSAGRVPAATLAAAAAAGVTEIYKVGGAQAIAALAFGTQTIAKTDVIAGPGNMYVALAKREVAGSVGIDSVAGPSEIAVVSDGSADPRVIAWDLIAQAEHGPHGVFAVVTWDPSEAILIESELGRILEEIDASAELREALEIGVVLVTVEDLDRAEQVVNELAPEHLELLFEGSQEHVFRFGRAGAIFAGIYSPVSLGDYLAGTNHVLPTGGAARWASGLRTSHFQKTSAVIIHGKESLRAARGLVEAFANIEGLPNHSKAVAARFEED